MSRAPFTLTGALAAVSVLASGGVLGWAEDDGSRRQSPTGSEMLTVATIEQSGPPSAAPAHGRSGELTPAATWLREKAVATSIPERALLAYGRAALQVQRRAPGCRLGWNTLAAIGQLESGHGTTAGRELDADGRPDRPVVGPALDGADYAAIAARPESVRWHGDARWEHAVGPMQFIFSTWARWGRDGDGDGSRDPHDLDDAALAAGLYLCEAGGDLSTAAGWRRAVWAYNHSSDYVAAVAGVANGYAAAH